MSAPWGGPDNVCPKCGSADVNPPDEGSWPSCNDCGHVQYDEDTLALQREVQREQQLAKQILGYVPKYEDWQFIQALEKRHMSSWTDEEIDRYNNLTDQE